MTCRTQLNSARISLAFHLGLSGLLALGLGCASQPAPVAEQAVKEQPLSSSADHLVLMAGRGCGIPGPWESCEWNLERGGRCAGKVKNGDLRFPNRGSRTTMYEVPDSVFAEALEVVRRTDFSPPKPYPKPFTFEEASYGSAVHYNGRVYSQNSSGELHDFIMALKNRGTIVKAVDEAAIGTEN